MNSIFGVLSADVRERSRRFSFLVLIAMALFAAFWAVPRTTDSFQIISIEPDVFVQGGNPSWIPVASLICLAFFMPFIGFFYLRNAIVFDEKTGVEQLIAASPIGNVRYLLGKFLSGACLMYLVTAVVMAGSYFMTLWHFPGEFLSPYAFLSPYLFLLTTVPLCSALAVLFGAFKPLRGVVGSIIFFAIAIVPMTLEFNDVSGMLLRSLDVTGLSSIVGILSRTSYELTGHTIEHLTIIGGGFDVDTPPTLQLVFNGLHYNDSDYITLGLMAFFSLFFVMLSAPLYSISKKFSKIRVGKLRKTKQKDAAYEKAAAPAYFAARPTQKTMWVQGIAAELKLLLGNHALIWKIIGLTGIALCIFLDMEIVQMYIVPILIMWFVNVFSVLGSREHQTDMLKLIGTIPSGKYRQIVYSWIAGLVVALVLVSPLVVRMSLVGQFGGVFSAVAGAVFITSFALFLGEYTKTSRFFEVILILLTYLILNDVSPMMYVATHPDFVSVARSGIYLLAGVAMGIAAVIKRVRV